MKHKIKIYVNELNQIIMSKKALFFSIVPIGRLVQCTDNMNDNRQSTLVVLPGGCRISHLRKRKPN
jgi:hypothetical protein